MYPANKISYYIISMGCSKNQVDSEKINGALADAGFIGLDSSENANIIIINTCGFIQSAKEESIEVVFDALEKIQDDDNTQDGFSKKLVVAGCLSERYFEEVKNEIQEIDLLYGVIDHNFVTSLCEKFNIIPLKSPAMRQQPIIRDLSYTYIKISEGCSNNCSYCAIPLIRGPHNSYAVEDVLNDVRDACSRGVKELNIVGQDITGYNYAGTDLVALISRIASIDDVFWIRLLYCHPDHITDSIINLFAHNKKVVPYIDIPFQHVSSKIVQSMGRKGDYATYLALISRLREKVPGICIRSTFMVGFPGETDEEFQELLAFISEAQLDRVGAFKYSPEENTLASSLQEQVSEKKKQKRYAALMRAQQHISGNKLATMIDTEVEVLVEEKIDENTYLGRTKNDAPEIDGVFYLTGSGLIINTFIMARVTDASEYDLFGELV